MTMQSKIRKVGNSNVMTLTAEMLALLDAKEGDILTVVRTDDGGLRIMPYDEVTARFLEIGERVMDENREALQALA